MNTKVDQLFNKIYNDTIRYIDLKFVDGDRNVGKLNSAKKISLSKEIVESFKQIIKKIQRNTSDFVDCINSIKVYHFARYRAFKTAWELRPNNLHK